MSDVFSARDALPLESMLAKLQSAVPLDNVEGVMRDMMAGDSAVPDDAALFFAGMARSERGRAALEFLADHTVRTLPVPAQTLEARAMNDVRREQNMAFMALIGRAIAAGRALEQAEEERKANAKPARTL
jgi:hypothetical protein